MEASSIPSSDEICGFIKQKERNRRARIYSYTEKTTGKALKRRRIVENVSSIGTNFVVTLCYGLNVS
jgi:hypothetical protein